MMDAFKEKRNPDWIPGDIVNGQIPWSLSSQTTMETFLYEYSLHDSHWKGLFLDRSGKAVISLLWDTHWTKGKIPFPEWGGGQFLFIRLLLSNLSVDKIDPIIVHVESGNIANDANKKALHRTRIQFLKNAVELIHAPTVEIICMDWEKSVIPIFPTQPG